MQRIRLDDLPRIIAHEQQRARRRVARAVARTASRGVAIVRRRIPVAHGPLRDSAHATDDRIVVDAPHAAAVEVGSRPHFPPLAPIIEWVKLRATQGLTRRGRVAWSRRVQSQATRVAKMMRSLEVREGRTRYTPIDAAEQVARQIAAGIAKHGTKPHWFARRSIPEITGILDHEIQKELRK